MPLSLYKRITQIGTPAEAFFFMFNMILGTYHLPFCWVCYCWWAICHLPRTLLPPLLAALINELLNGLEMRASVREVTGPIAPEAAWDIGGTS
jgi:hypothetical protein